MCRQMCECARWKACGWPGQQRAERSASAWSRFAQERGVSTADEVVEEVAATRLIRDAFDRHLQLLLERPPPRALHRASDKPAEDVPARGVGRLRQLLEAPHACSQSVREPFGLPSPGEECRTQSVPLGGGQRDLCSLSSRKHQVPPDLIEELALGPGVVPEDQPAGKDELPVVQRPLDGVEHGPRRKADAELRGDLLDPLSGQEAIVHAFPAQADHELGQGPPGLLHLVLRDAELLRGLVRGQIPGRAEQAKHDRGQAGKPLAIPIKRISLPLCELLELLAGLHQPLGVSDDEGVGENIGGPEHLISGFQTVDNGRTPTGVAAAARPL
mmetsp:Transcript_106179/g.317192  ORF Transcript_106179/g.317192 Transcript_106179/m.317192 type:complete len:329 (-) Transcript_106179:909-1895(-)